MLSPKGIHDNNRFKHNFNIKSTLITGTTSHAFILIACPISACEVGVL